MSRPFVLSVSGPPQRRVSTLPLFYAMSPLILIAATWQLWIPHHDRFPQTPFFASLTTCPAIVDWICLAVALGGLVVSAVSSASSNSRIARPAAICFLLSFALLVILDQQRFQPWAYHLILIWLVLLAFDSSNPKSKQHVVQLLQVLVIGIYFHSAVSKFDTGFADQHGRQILAGFFEATGIETDRWLDRQDPRWLQRRRLLFPMPLLELVAAIGLCWKRTRKFAVAMVLLAHAFLIVALGPWGLDHELGVLAWNVIFMAQAVLLFWFPSNPPDESQQSVADECGGKALTARIIQKLVVVLIVLLGLILPFGRPTYWDIWPSWSLYSPRDIELLITIDEAEVNRVTGPARNCISAPDFNGRCHVRVDQWALGELSAPMYPSPRIECAAARWLQSKWQLDSVRLTIKGDPRSQMPVSRIPAAFSFQWNTQPNLRAL